MTHMPEKKLSMKEFSQIVQESESTIRYYETQFLLKPKRSKNGRRYFTDTDLEWFKFLVHIKSTGMSIKEMKQYVLWSAEGEKTITDRRILLEHARDNFLKKYGEIEHHLQVINDKIDWYKAKEDGTIRGEEPFADYLKRIGHPAP
ncbi:MerR family transcriptional regulator [Liquorilactobacillus satsumensis]|uniref:MerR family transcriptional regulator n=1 Tax=Liquorilactobacillus TaxID=2767888 RepID=UPI0021C4B462|nr:MerR family transcriptional regulator [Liquorilactobacillus satsumensis]MCP9328702.1 MerR family transcriptional regulator [Liquorilactobacillus satsumensis]